MNSAHPQKFCREIISSYDDEEIVHYTCQALKEMEQDLLCCSEECVEDTLDKVRHLVLFFSKFACPVALFNCAVVCLWLHIYISANV